MAFLARLLGAAEAQEAAQPATTTPTATVEPAAAPGRRDQGDVEIIGLYAHYDERASQGENLVYSNIDPRKYPKVWVAFRGVKPGAVTFGLKVDGRMPTEDEIETDGTVVEATGQQGIAVLDYPPYGVYRDPGTHVVTVLLGHATGEGKAVEWYQEVMFAIRTVRDE